MATDRARTVHIAAALSVAFVLGATACSESNPTALDDVAGVAPPAGLVISNPVASTVAYVSAKPGTFPEAVLAEIRNSTRPRAPLQVPMTDGGFDPVGIDARAGDVVSITLSLVRTPTRISFSTTVPARRAPAIVRTVPSRDRIDVTLSAELLMVFSEPIDKSSVTSSTLVLLAGANAVTGTVRVSADGLSAVFIPNGLLQHETTYSVAIKQGIRDLDGDALDGTSAIEFTTPSAIPGGVLMFSMLSDRQLYRSGADGIGLTRLTATASNERPSWSPDGLRVAFARNFQGPSNNGFGVTDIYLMDADGSNVVRRTVNGTFRSAAWSPDGRMLALSDEGIYYSEIHLVSAIDDGAAPRLLARDARSPSWSPDGRLIAFVRTSGDDGYDQIFVMNTDGTGVRPLTEMGGGMHGLAWSPNGKRIGYSKCQSGDCGLFVMDASGGGVKRISIGGNAQGVSWSPDGKYIAFTSSEYSGREWHPSVAYVSAEGGTPRIVAAGAFWPAWRP